FDSSGKTVARVVIYQFNDRLPRPGVGIEFFLSVVRYHAKHMSMIMTHYYTFQFTWNYRWRAITVCGEVVVVHGFSESLHTFRAQHSTGLPVQVVGLSEFACCHDHSYHE